jgi:hypothetical protein
MLPASFQLPAAILLVAGGLLSCFAGYRVFRVVLGIYGFIIGALAASSMMGGEHTMGMLVAALIGGLIGAVILILAYFVGVALIGAGLGAVAVNLLAGVMHKDPHPIVVIVVAILGAIAALSLQRYVIIVATAFGGAQTVVVGACALLGERVAAAASARTVYSVYPLDPLPNTGWDQLAAIVLGIVGVIVQLGYTAKGKKK